MKNKSVKRLLQRSLAVSLMAAMLATTGLSNTTAVSAYAAETQAQDESTAHVVQNGEAILQISEETDGYYVTTASGTEKYTLGMTLLKTVKEEKQSSGGMGGPGGPGAPGGSSQTTVSYVTSDLSPEDAMQLIGSGGLNDDTTLTVYTTVYNTIFGSYQTRGNEDFRIGYYITEDGEDSAGTYSLGSNVLLGSVSANKGVTTLSGITMESTSDNMNGVVVQGNDGTAKAVIKNSIINMLGNSDGDNDVCDFDAWGSAVSAFDDAQLTISDTTIKTTGVGRCAVEADDGADVLIQDTDIDVLGGTLYDSYRNTALQTKMVAPPWVLGIVGNARATNLLGDYSTMTVYNSDVYAAKWGVLSTDACSNVVLNTINSSINMDLSGDDLTEDTGYGTYAIGAATENFLGTTFNVPTYAVICANGENILNFKSSAGDIQTRKYNGTNWENGLYSFADSEVKDQKTVVNSENFGINIWGGATVNVSEKTTFNTGSAAFLVKTGGSYIGSEINIDDSSINSDNDVILQVLDNEDSAAEGVSFDEEGNGPFFDTVVYKESAGWLGVDNDDIYGQGAGADTELNVTNSSLDGNIYNGSGYKQQASALKVNLGENASLTGAISATTIKHTTDGGKTQNTEITEDTYYQFGHVINKANFNEANAVEVNLTDNAVWTVDEESLITSLTVGKNAVLKGDVYVNGQKVNVVKGQTYTGEITVKPAETVKVQAAQKISVKTSYTKAYKKNATFTLGASAKTALTYTSNNKSVAAVNSKTGKVTIKGIGTAKITVKAAATSSYKAASATVTVKVNPAKGSVTKVTSPAKGKLRVTWKKDSTVTGYKIQYSTDKSFKKNVKTVTVSKNSTTSKTISKNVTSGKQYYVRVAGYKKVSGKTYTGTYSKAVLKKVK